MSKRKTEGKDTQVKDLASRRMQQLAEENSQLRQYVAEVMQRLRDNESLFARLFELESDVLSATDPEDLCFALLRGLRSGFELDMARFWLDRSSVIGGRRMEAISERDLVWLEEGEIRDMGLARQRVLLLALKANKGFDWLESRDSHLGSLALMTLGDLSRPFGVLGLGSVDADRFCPGQATDFLQHLAQVVGLSLENAMAHDRLARLAITDTLTGSRNRRFLQPHSHHPLSQWFGQDVGVACLYLDVDGFKSINDRLGHEVGDDILAAVCKQVRAHVRSQDPLIRMGGDEFTLLLPGCSPQKAEAIAERIVKSCSKLRKKGEHIGVSIGLAYSTPQMDMRVKELIASADRAMYVAKALGGSRFEVAKDDV